MLEQCVREMPNNTGVNLMKHEHSRYVLISQALVSIVDCSGNVVHVEHRFPCEES